MQHILFLLCMVSIANGLECIKWRETSDCSPFGKRLPSKDASCIATIGKKRSGYCECEGNKRARESDCDHHTFNCKIACGEEEDVNLEIPSEFSHVTCGSSIKLIHDPTRYRLHSHEINYGSGSKQQTVTAHGGRNDPNSYWLVKEAHDEVPCVLGSKIQCQSIVRLEHVHTRRNLHSHDYRSPLSSHEEVSGFGVAGDGDVMDNWRVECLEEMQCDADKKCEDDGTWKRERLVRLRNVNTNGYLMTDSKYHFDNSNCPNCPINGQQEVSTIPMAGESSLWFAGEGIYIGV